LVEATRTPKLYASAPDSTQLAFTAVDSFASHEYLKQQWNRSTGLVELLIRVYVPESSVDGNHVALCIYGNRLVGNAAIDE
jgi:hypothetical protein